MAQQSAEQEPTMEEILASIRRIINEDDEVEAQPDADADQAESGHDGADLDEMPQPAEAASDDEAEDETGDEAGEDDVLELTDRIEEEGSGTDPLSIADDLMILDREDEAPAEPDVEDESVAEAEPEPEPVAAAPEPVPAPASNDDDEDSLLAETTAGAAAGAFAALSDNLRISSEPNQTLEGVVRELLRPMLKQWLDDNLPAIVEEKVQAEIERVARRRR